MFGKANFKNIKIKARGDFEIKELYCTEERINDEIHLP